MSSTPRGPLAVALIFSLSLLAIPALVFADDRAQVLETLTVDDVRELAIEHNPELQLLRIERRRAELLLEREQTARTPLWTSDARYRYGQAPFLSPEGTRLIDSSSLNFGTRLVHTFSYGTQLGVSANLGRAARDSVELGELGIAWDTRVGVDLSQPLLRGFGPRIVDANIELAERSLESFHLQERTALSAVLRDVLAAYWRLWMAEQTLQIQQESLAISQQNLENAEFRRDTGVLSEADIISLRTEVASARERLLAAQTRRNQEALALSRDIGLPPDQALSAGDDALPPIPAITFDEALQAFRDASPDYQRRLVAMETARIQAELAQDNTRPRLDATGSFFLDGLDRGPGSAFAQMSRFEGWVATAGLRLELPVNNRSRLAEAERADLAVEAERAELHRLDQRESARIAALLEEIQTARARADLARETASLARQNVDAQSARFDVGRATSFQVIDALHRLQEAELRVVEIEASLLQQLLTLQHLMGEIL